ncbi:nicotinamidase [Ignisphaera sp. 4213-co]|uniref:nicotinamidase n=1 Tax=Ignisphaera cupida TaxID=3050454 RepID=A0ABD4Z4Q1_9CREN|nr:nicotinamidase [Ignisphaera sp. 4213-co]MDK6028130.1 nicotinamidase [Ignisphaera sp. 4213-co]
MAKIKILPIDALIIVDMQNDFMPGGTLPVPNALTIISAINKYIELFEKSNALIVATRDWHPPNHISFNTRGGPWPPHCIQNTWGAEFHKDLKLPRNTIVISKAFKEDKEAYSGFEDTELDNTLKSRNIKRLFIAGVATEYCVKATAEDGVKLGYQVFLLEDAIKGIDSPPGSEEKAIEDLMNKGVVAIKINDVIAK